MREWLWPAIYGVVVVALLVIVGVIIVEVAPWEPACPPLPSGGLDCPLP